MRHTHPTSSSVTALSYVSPPAAARGPSWSLLSLFVALAAWLIGHGGYALWDSRTVPRPPMQADFGHDLTLLATSLSTILLGPVIGIVFCALGLRLRPRRWGLSLVAVFLNLWVWVFPLMVQTSSYPIKFDPRRWRLTASGTALLGVIILYVCGTWAQRVDQQNPTR